MPREVEEGAFNSLSSTPRGSWVLPTTPPTARGIGTRLGSRRQPLSLTQAWHKYSGPCAQLMGVNTTVAMICVVTATPYMTWAAWAGNFATLAKGIRHVPKWNSYLEGVDTLLIGVYIIFCLFLFIWRDHFCLHLSFGFPTGIWRCDCHNFDVVYVFCSHCEESVLIS
jgi:hypothetical protein